jgi:hypothetical protein
MRKLPPLLCPSRISELCSGLCLGAMVGAAATVLVHTYSDTHKTWVLDPWTEIFFIFPSAKKPDVSLEYQRSGSECVVFPLGQYRC